MRTFRINVDENLDGYEVVVSDTKDERLNDVVLTEDMNEDDATNLIASLNLVLLQYFKDYKPFVWE